MTGKATIQFHRDTLRTVLRLSEKEPEIILEFLDAALRFDETGEVPETFRSNTAEVMFAHAMPQLQESREQYNKMIEQRKKAAISRWMKERGLKD